MSGMAAGGGNWPGEDDPPGHREQAFRVSVVIPVFNACRYLERAVDSALAQEETHEVVLVDDGSDDASLALCQRLARADARIRVLQHPGGEHRGIAESRNLALRVVSAPFVAFLDADDYYLPKRFELARKVLLEDPSLDGVHERATTGFETPDARARFLRRGEAANPGLATRVAPGDLFRALVSGRRGGITTTAIVVRKTLLDKAGGFDSLTLAEDAVMWCKLAALGRLGQGSLSRPVSVRWVHGAHHDFRVGDENLLLQRARWSTLLAWCRSNGIEQSKACVVVQRYFEHFSILHLESNRSVPSRGREAWAGLGSLIRNYPAAALCLCFWRPWAWLRLIWRILRRSDPAPQTA